MHHQITRRRYGGGCGVIHGDRSCAVPRHVWETCHCHATATPCTLACAVRRSTTILPCAFRS